MRVVNISISRVVDDFFFFNIFVIVIDVMDDWEVFKMFYFNFLIEVIKLIFYLVNV